MSSDNNRKFYRADFKTEGYITLKGDQCITFGIENISLKGILIICNSDKLVLEESYPLCVKLHGTSIEIKTNAILVHKEGNKLGFYFQDIDLDSMIHLRRLLELNVDKEGEIEKELSFLNSYS